MANMIARLGVLLGIDSAEFNRGIEEASRKLEQFGESVEKYGKIAATGLAAASVAALKYADDIADVAKANDVAVSSILKLREALAQNGGEAENASRLMSSFNSFVAKAADGSFEAQRSFKSLGISLSEISTLSIDELFSKTASGLSSMEDPVMRNARGFEIFGKAVRGVDLVGLNESLNEANELTDKQAEAIKAAADMFDMLEKHARNTALTIALELGPPLKATVEYFDEMLGKSNLLGTTLKTTFQTIAIVLSDVAFVIEGIYRQTLQTILLFKSFIPGTDVEGKWSQYVKEAEESRKRLDEFQRKIMEGGGSNTPEGKPNAPGGRPVTPGVDPEAERRRRENQRAFEEKMKEFALFQKNNQMYEDRQNLAASILQKEQEIFKINLQAKYNRQEDNALAVELVKIEAQRRDNIQKLENDASLFSGDRLERIQKENELAEKAIELARERNRLVKESREGDILKGATDKMYEYVNSMKTQMELGAEMFTSLMGNMESALDRFVQTGKLSFKDLARSIIQDLIRIQMRAQMMRMFSSLFGFGVGGVRGPDNIDVGGGWNPASADGGPVDANKIGLVGERGPELFVPKTAGTIIPNNQLAGALGGQTNVTNNYINAIDTKSFEQRLLESSNTIWAGYTYANKTLASNGRRA